MHIRSLLPAILVLVISACGGDPAPSTPATPSGPVDSLALAIKAIEQRMVQDPGNASLYAERATLHERADSLKLAINDLLRAVALDSLNTGYRNRLGGLYYTTVQVDKATTAFEEVVRIDPANTEALLKLAEIKLVLRDHPGSIELVNKALRIDPDLAKGYYLKGFVYMETGDTATAISSFRTAVERDPRDYNSYMQLGLLSAGRKDPLALDYFNTAIELRPRSMEALYGKAMYLQEVGEDSAALETYARMVDIDSTNAVAYHNSGFVRMEYLRDLEGAKRDLGKAIAMNPNYQQAWYNRGVAMERSDQLDSAAANYQMALMIDPGYHDAAVALDRLARKGVRIKTRERKKTP
ncbi:MAG: tetratricopeptide repeat protein [Flavobacteriales bacterium]|nr:tetratricopeptide repeat protein [Flavobacteriales bacterium]